MKILIVDDDVDVRSLLEDALIDAGYSVIMARNGEEGLAGLREGHVSLVITDLIMPGKDGLEFIRDLREEFADMKVVAMTGGIYDFPMVGQVDGADQLITKPFHIKDVLALVSDLIGES